ncbi:maleylpyruvate isomerase family mycothiol-dependent enzyme [Streptomyces poonensis]|uniref:Maleylpyruvate isomerase family mycothiol-dependent enzyme n=1 Tax=Streptomyces poonensis TaxID=68255 RepID=A0A918Q7J1_9ACTN|nr:maleylpyruvate isomerase family mycothiol-dependent enzyme [Streptomyces poonensis]GGZ35751.1 hypothetical protein GCM10010365_65830 [Streptomyces poonensis]GLJ89644.1 hypothetical protein GCM10017589_22440 [Streptomyces poonensis]
METDEHVKILDREGRLLTAAAEAAGSGAEVPTCPGWRVRDLLRHTGTVHRWAGAFVADGHTSPRPIGDEPDLDGAELLDWFREGHQQLVETLATAPADTDCWSFLPAPSPVAFWARRQAHETAVHRFDAESARDGAPTTPTVLSTDFAVDGIDEVLLGFHARQKSRVRTERPRVLGVRTTDTDAVWTVRLSDGPPVSERGRAAEADCEVAGPAAELCLALWNRLPFPEVSGDASLAGLWREKSAVI